MAAILGQQVISLASNTLKIAAAALAVHDSSSWWSSPCQQPEKELKTFTLDEISWHWEASDCWMVLYDKVYDLTDFLVEHPGGYDVLLEHAGRDATVAFRGVGHSQQALVAMEKYCVGILVENERLYTRSYSQD